MMGHDMKLDKFYYDQDSEESRKKIILEYMKVVKMLLPLMMNIRLLRQIADYEDKLKNVPKVEQLQEQLSGRIIEQDSIKITVEKLQREKELQDKQMIAMRDMVDHTLEEMMTMVQQK